MGNVSHRIYKFESLSTYYVAARMKRDLTFRFSKKANVAALIFRHRVVNSGQTETLISIGGWLRRHLRFRFGASYRRRSID